MLRQDDHVPITSITFEFEDAKETDIFDKINELTKPKATRALLYDDLCVVRDAFKSPRVRLESKKVLIVFVNDLNNVEGVQDVIGEIQGMDVRLVAVGFGDQANLNQLEKITKRDALHFEEFESARTVGTAIVQDVEGKDVYEIYVDYFTTPYFIFFRDTLSAVALLGLLSAICLTPSAIAFSKTELAVLLFFLGRIVVVADQFICATKTERKATRKRHRSFQTTLYEECSDPDLNADTSYMKLVLRKFVNYCNDRWHACDFIILIMYVMTATLRMVTWVSSSSVSGNGTLAITGYLYGLIASFLTVRAFGHVMEVDRGMGAIEIAVFVILKDLRTIFWLFVATILGFSLALTKTIIVETSYISSGNFHKDRGYDFTRWWDIARDLVRSLLGMTSLTPLESHKEHGPSAILANLLYIRFLVVGAILLINLMIALLSNTYEIVQNNALKEWSFKKAVTVKTYSTCHPAPVPINLVTMPLIAVCRMCQRCLCKTKSFEMPGVREESRDAALDKLVEKLQRTYFATYGYSFPLTDEGKIDEVLHETDGNRKMCNQIIQRVFEPSSLGQTIVQNGTFEWESLGIGIEGSLLTYEGSSSCYSCENRKISWAHHGARGLAPFTPEMPRFEVLIQESGERRIVAVGAVYEGYNCHFMPGWKNGTVGYHADDGRIFEPSYRQQGKEVPDAMAYRGDLMACEVDFEGARNDSVPVTFFKNNIEVARTSLRFIPDRTKLFPFIGMGYTGIRVLAKMCPRHNQQAQRPTDAINIPWDTNVQEKLDILREEMNVMEINRKQEVKELESKLLYEIRQLTREIREKNI
ncbi:Short transient receptor potential channel 4 [Stylophora pistillata]|uniref:Short transient receptor potential channel 4 n=2 Tax=Stylophora pistillata TaxID=50429 RepID=A0A2B4S6M8_STYPI|nr:Short transient receptor potential channel 4 [Stylophora pistillata]